MKINHLRHFKIRKFIALFTLLTYVISQPSWAAPMVTLNAGAEVRDTGPAEILPPEFGSLTEVSGETPSFFIIPDAHGQLEAQKSTERILNFLNRKRGLKTLLIEGGSGKLEPERLAFFREEPLNLQVAGILMREAEIGGAERFALQHRNEISAYGIEDLDLYLRNFRLYTDVAERGPETRAWFEKKLAEMRGEASKTFPKSLFDFFKDWLGFEDEQIPLLSYLESLEKQALETLKLNLKDARAQLDWPMLVRYFELQKRESLIREKKAKEQRELLSRWAAGNGLPQIPASGREESGAGLRAFWEGFYELASPKGFKFETYPDFFALEGSRVLGGEIEARVLMEEVSKLRGQIVSALAVDPASRELVGRFHDLLMLRKFLSLSVSSSEYESWARMAGPASERLQMPEKVLEVYRDAMEFYRLAGSRDDAMSREILAHKPEDRETAAIIAGGFHTEGISRKLREAGLSYAVIMPHLSAVEDGKKYDQAMSAQPRKLDFGASTVRVPQWMMEDDVWPAALTAARSEIRGQISAYGLARGANPRSGSRSEVRTVETAGEMLPDFGGRMLPLSIRSQNRFMLLQPDPAENPQIFYESDPLEAQPVLLDPDRPGKTNPEILIQNALKYLDSAVEEKYQPALEWLKRNVFIQAIQLPTILFYDDGKKDDDLFEKALQISYRRKVLLFSLDFLNSLDPANRSDQALVALYLMRAADLLLTYQDQVSQLTYENENQGLLPQVFGEIYEGLRRKKDSYSWRQHLRFAESFIPRDGLMIRVLSQTVRGLVSSHDILERIKRVRAEDGKRKAGLSDKIREQRDQLMRQTEGITRIFSDNRWEDMRPKDEKYRGKDPSEIPREEMDRILYGDGTDKDPGMGTLMMRQAEAKMVEVKAPELAVLREELDMDDVTRAAFHEIGIDYKDSREELQRKITEIEKNAKFMPTARAELSGQIDELSKIAFYYQSSGMKKEADEIYFRILLLLKALQKIDMVGFFPMQVQQQIIYLYLRRGDIQMFRKEFQRLLDVTYVPWVFRVSQRNTQGVYMLPGTQGGLRAGWGGIFFWIDDALPDICLKLQVIASAFDPESELAEAILEIESQAKDIWWQLLKVNRFDTDLRDNRQERMKRPMVIAAKEKEADTSTAVSAAGRLRKMEEPYRIFYGFSWKRKANASVKPGEKPAVIEFRVSAYRRAPDGSQNPAGYLDVKMVRQEDGSYAAQVDPEGEKWAGRYSWVDHVIGDGVASPGLLVHPGDQAQAEGLAKALLHFAQMLVEASGGGTVLGISQMKVQRSDGGLTPVKLVEPKGKILRWAPGVLSKTKPELWKRHSGFLGVKVRTKSGDYVIDQVLDREGNGRVYRARSSSKDKQQPPIAVKVFSDPGYRFREIREAQIRHEAKALAAAGRNNNFVPAVYGRNIGFHDQFSLIGMEYLEGQTLKDWITETKTPDERITISKRVIAAVAGVSENKVIHLDLKPSNFFVTNKGSIKVLDFTYSQVEDEAYPEDPRGGVHGTPGYMAPEMFEANGDLFTPATDVFLLGATIFEILTGQRLFEIPSGQEEDYSSIAASRKKKLPASALEDRLKLPEEIKDKVSVLLRKALDPVPANRFKDAEEFREAFRAAFPPRRSEARINFPSSVYLNKRLEVKKFSNSVYQLVEFIGGGEMSGIYRAVSVNKSGPDIAVKITPSDILMDSALVRDRVSHEAAAFQTAARNNLYTPEFLGFGLDTGNGFSAMAMEYVPGVTLDEWAKGKSDEDKIRMAMKAGRAVASLHNSSPQILHLDLKPQNFLVTPDGRVKIFDFQTAQYRGKNMPSRGAWKVEGTPAYMAPEMFVTGSGPYEPSTDVYMLAETLFALGTGENLFKSESPVDLIEDHKRQVTSRELGSRLPKAWHVFIPVLRKALDVSPEKRYHNAEEFLVAMEQAAPAELQPKILMDPSVFIGRRLRVDGKEYVLDSLAGSGGYAWVFKAYGTGTEALEPVAVKVFRHVNRENASKNEYHAMQQFAKKDSRYVPAVLGWGHIQGPQDPLPAIVMEYLEGANLAAWIEKKSPYEGLRQALAILEAVALMHPDIVHLDLKPANIFISENGVKIIDFGVSRFGSRIGQPLHRVLGTYFFAAPEALDLSGRVDPRLDVYSLGVLLYWMAIHRTPFTPPADGNFNSSEFLDRLWEEKQTPPSVFEIRVELSRMGERVHDVWGPAANVIARAISTDPAARYSSVIEMSQALRDAVFRSEQRIDVNLNGKIYTADPDSASSGAYAQVYEAQDPVDGTKVALKVFDSGSGIDREDVEREYQSMQRAASESNPFVPRPIGIGSLNRANDPGVLVMEYAEGQDLSEWKTGKTPSEIIAVSRQILAALKSLHERGVYHGDIKPRNIRISPAGLKLVDFNLSILGLDIHNRGFTMNYAAPENLDGMFSPESEVYSAAAVIYELATNQRLTPRQSTYTGHRNAKFSTSFTPGEMAEKLKAAGADPAWLPLAPVLAKASQPYREDRYRGIGEMLAAMDFAISGKRSELRITVELNGKTYEGTDQIGSGGLGAVYKGRDAQADRELALKVYDTYSDISPEDLNEEYALMKKAHLASPDFVPDVLGVGRVTQSAEEVNGDKALIMEFVAGETLDKWREGKSSAQLQKTAEDVLAAHSAIYQSGVLHGDIKPQNIIMTPDNKVKVIDFGLAVPAGQGRPNKGFTDQFAAPESPNGVLESQTEVYSLGLFLFWTATGRRLFSPLSPRVLRTEKLLKNFSNTEIEDRLREEGAGEEWFRFASVIAKAVKAEAFDRYADPSELLKAWRAVSGRSELRMSPGTVETIKNETYEIVDEIGKGAFAKVFKARRVRDGKMVALKYFRRQELGDRDLKADALREFRNLQMITRAGGRSTPEVYDHAEIQGRQVLVFEWIEGQSSDEWRQAHSSREALPLAEPLLEGIKTIHDARVHHLDLKPNNVVITPENNVKIVDMGLSLVETEFVEGVTPTYAAPEMFESLFSRRSDVYSAAIILYEWATDQLLFNRRRISEIIMEKFEADFTEEKIRKRLEENGALDWVPFAAVLAKALRYDPDDRYQTMDEMLTAWRAISGRSELRTDEHDFSGATFKINNENYIIKNQLGKGGYGWTWSAEKIGDPGARPVAVKIYNVAAISNASSRVPALIARSGAAIQKIRSRDSRLVPEVLGTAEISTVDRVWPAVVMEYLGGQQLDDWAKKQSGLGKRQAARLILQAVNLFQEEGILHRDLKPENILVEDSKNGQPQIHFVDWDLARVDEVGKFAAINGRDTGTPNYMAPELFLGGASLQYRQDLYSLGVIFYELATSRNVVAGEEGWDAQKWFSVKINPPALNQIRMESSYEWKPLAEVIANALARRYSIAKQMLDDFEQQVSGRSELRQSGKKSELTVAEKVTARILGLEVMARFYSDLFPQALAAEPEVFVRSEARQELIENYAGLFRTGASAVLPAQLLLKLSDDARNQYLDFLEEGFQKSGSPAGKAVYFAGEGADRLSQLLRARPKSGVFEIVRQGEVLAAGRRSKDAVSVSVTAAPENLRELYHLPSFLIDPAVLEKMDAASSFKYLHNLTQLQLLAAVQLKKDLGDVVQSGEYLRRMAEFLGKVGIEYTSQAGLVTPTPQSLLAETLVRYLRTQQLTASAA